ncbi:MAG: alpha/beta hydrolase, partial [Gemmatimonas sp.]
QNGVCPKHQPRAIADDVGVVADQLALARVVPVGHSMGRAAAIAYAGAHPGRVAGVVVEGAGGKMDDKMARPMIVAIIEFWTRSRWQ